MCLAWLGHQHYFKIKALQSGAVPMPEVGGRRAPCRVSQGGVGAGRCFGKFLCKTPDNPPLNMAWAIWTLGVLESSLPKYHSSPLIYHMALENIIRYSSL